MHACGHDVHTAVALGVASVLASVHDEVPGTVKPGTQSGNNLTPTFMADDSAIPIGLRAMVNVLLDYLRAAA